MAGLRTRQASRVPGAPAVTGALHGTTFQTLPVLRKADVQLVTVLYVYKAARVRADSVPFISYETGTSREHKVGLLPLRTPRTRRS